RLITKWRASKHFVLCVRTIRDGKQVISCGAAGDPGFKIWDIETGELLAAFGNGFGYQNTVAISKDETQFLSGGEDTNLRLWDVASGECLATFKGHADAVAEIQIAANGRLAVSSSNDSTVKLWDLETHACIGTLEGHEDNADAIAISPDDNLIASSGFGDKTVRLWDRQSAACLQVIHHEETPYSIAFAPDGSRLVVGTIEGADLHLSPYWCPPQTVAWDDAPLPKCQSRIARGGNGGQNLAGAPVGRR
ncbi:MAG: WD40 repeat domain-containing protein, partial [Verrucomicrobia bacterium]|nr:WD40 repeat domain-containing protein [Verrucomicrobiota bacterium]